MQLIKASLLHAALLFFSRASADIWIGIASGQYQCGNSGAGPQNCPWAQWIRMIGEEAGDICESTVGPQPDGFPHAIKDLDLTGGEDGVSDTWNLCGIKLCEYDDVVMGEGGNCGKDGSQSPDGIADGTSYATLYDRYNNNEPVGECVYEMGESDNCGERGGSIIGHTWLHCYTDPYICSPRSPPATMSMAEQIPISSGA